MRPDTQSPASPLTVDRDADGAYVVHAITPAGVVSLGTHANVVDAWAAIDELDSPDGVDQLARAA
jgi:hypothetical protein